MLAADLQENQMRPLLRWAGSKRKLLPHILNVTPETFGRYYEPFAGSACLFFHLAPQRAVLGDINRQLIRMYDILRSHPLSVARAVASMPRNKAFYYSLREIDPSALKPVQEAARFIYLNRFCFNGVYRTNPRGFFNVPRGRRTGPLPSISEFRSCAMVLRNAELRPGDFRDCLEDVAPGDFVYLDPPYVKFHRRFRGEYGCAAGDVPTLPELCSTLRDIERRGAHFVFSYADSAAVRRACSAWTISVVRVRRHVAGFTAKRRRVSEILVTNESTYST